MEAAKQLPNEYTLRNEADATSKDFRVEGACVDQSNELFFPKGTTGPAEIQIEQAKAVCATCVVRAECLNFAITTNQEYGIWGGTDEEERRVLRRQWRQGQRALRKKSN